MERLRLAISDYDINCDNSPEFLKMKKGDIIELIKPTGKFGIGKIIQGEYNRLNEKGSFPLSLTIPILCKKSLHSFDAPVIGNLSMEKGEIVIVIKECGDWFEVINLKKEQGLVPICSVGPVSITEAYHTLKKPQKPKGEPPKSPGLIGKFFPLQINQIVYVLFDYNENDFLKIREGNLIQVTGVENGFAFGKILGTNEEGWFPTTYITSLKNFRIALYDHVHAQPSEIPIKEGELVIILKEDDSGWFEAANIEKIRGWIPGNYVGSISEEKIIAQLTKHKK